VVHIVTNGQLLVAWGPRARSIMFGSIIHDIGPYVEAMPRRPEVARVILKRDAGHSSQRREHVPDIDGRDSSVSPQDSKPCIVRRAARIAPYSTNERFSIGAGRSRRNS